MRDAGKLAIGDDDLTEVYASLEAQVGERIEDKAAGVDRFGSEIFGIAQGDDEAMYRWLAANYTHHGSVGERGSERGTCLPVAEATKGFLEMGGHPGD